MAALNPFDVGINEMGNLTPRRKQYIQKRNVAQDERINSISGSILQYQEIIAEVRGRYKVSGPEDQCLIKPYLKILYFELGQLFEAQEKPQEALRYYELSGTYGHLMSIENAKRLGSKISFVSAERACSNKLDNQRELPIDELVISEALYKDIILIKSEGQKGSGVLAKDDRLGNVLITVEHVAIPGAIAYVGEQEIILDHLEVCKNGPNTMFILDDRFEIYFENAPSILTNRQLKVGEKVYFGGYPFKKTNARLHTGHVSSVGKKGEFSIDGVAVPGMSGGPIGIELEGKIYVVGTIASETFDPIEGFSKALCRMYVEQADAEARYEHTRSLQHESWKWMKQSPQFTKITREQFTIGVMDRSKTIELESLKDKDPDIFKKMWDDLNRNGVVSIDGEIDETKIVPGQLGLREEFQQYEEYVLNRLRKSTTDLIKLDPETIQLASKTEKPTDSMNTVGLSLVQSLSTGLITCHLFQELYDQPLSSHTEEATEFEIGRKNRNEKAKKKITNQAYRERAAAKKDGTFRNTGLPRVLYRFVSKEDAKDIKKNGIIHLGGDLDEIHFMTKPEISMAKSVGAMSTDKRVTVYTDRIPNITKDNVRMVAERNHIGTYRINVSIPANALEISET